MNPALQQAFMQLNRTKTVVACRSGLSVDYTHALQKTAEKKILYMYVCVRARSPGILITLSEF